MIVPSDHQAVIDEVARLSRAFAELVSPLSEAGLNWRPTGLESAATGAAGGSWSIGQCVEHLTRTGRLYLPALRAAAEKGRAKGRGRHDSLRPNRLGKWFIRMLEPPVRMRVRAAKRSLLPAVNCEKASTWSDFLEVQEEFAELVRSSSDLDLIRLRFRNPLLGGLPVFNLATGFLVVAAHERRHLEQARSVRAHARFPS